MDVSVEGVEVVLTLVMMPRSCRADGGGRMTAMVLRVHSWYGGGLEGAWPLPQYVLKPRFGVFWSSFITLLFLHLQQIIVLVSQH